ncbi:MAG: 1-acyl-sn-glycerol-3-phosphate acyltransferase [Clostridiales bacterium]|nr:1-acyl-sn-glycerol-3-phosphate acyltransferase [Clostridiales bacterium]
MSTAENKKTEKKPVSPEKERTFFYTAARFLAAVLFDVLFPLRYHNTERYQLDAPFIAMSNHQTWLDPLILAKPCKKYELRFVGKKELVKNRFAKWVLGKMHMITVDRHNTDMAAMRQISRVLKDGYVLGIFPEGTRHLPDLMSEIESGTAFMALRANVPLLPVFIDGKPRFLRLRHVYVGEPIDISDLREQGYDAAVVEQVNERIRSTFLAMRAQAHGEK